MGRKKGEICVANGIKKRSYKDIRRIFGDGFNGFLDKTMREL